MIGQLLLNRYRLDSELGQGGMGVVYRATDTLLQRPVAVKMLNATGLGTQGRARLLAEARASAKLNHSNIVTIHDAGEMDGTPFIVMELVEGRSLRDQWPQSLDEALSIARQVCAALDHAHTNGIIHRDIKPENIVLALPRSPVGAFPPGVRAEVRAKLTDFGLARFADAHAPHLTEDGAIVGTFGYLAPELLMGQPASAQSDLYALGVMLYELTVGRLPFAGENLAGLLAQHLHAEPISPREYSPVLSPDVADPILQLLSKQPADRPISAAVVGRALALALPSAMRAELAELQAAPKTNLPTHLSSFVGREKEIAQIKQRLKECRLVTLTGSGGIGKTRLSLQVAAELQDRFFHGVWLVQLAPLADPELLPQTVAAVFGLPPQGDTPILAMLTNYLRAKSLLLILDNCEHLIDACAQLAETLLRASLGLRLLASSREALGIEGESAYRVPSLSLPDPHGAPAAIAEAEAVQRSLWREPEPPYQALLSPTPMPRPSLRCAEGWTAWRWPLSSRRRE